MTGRASFRAIGTTVAVVTDSSALDTALAVVRSQVTALDEAVSRFRDDSELSDLLAATGRPTVVSPVLFSALRDALVAASMTDGLVDPTVGEALERCGYDRDFDSVAPDGPALAIRFRRVAGWRDIRLDSRNRTAMMPAGVRVDLGATAKAGCADRAAAIAASRLGTGVLVNLGGDIAVSGPPPVDGWAVRITDRHDAAHDEPGVVVSISTGGLATSGTVARRWHRGGELFHHLIDPDTGAPADPYWRTVTVAADSCLSANVASTASVILGAGAPEWLTLRGHHARLVREGGHVTTVGGWPAETVDPELAPC